MRATEIIRSVLDLIDHIEIEKKSVEATTTVEPTVDAHGDDTSRFRQIVDLLTSEYSQMYNNSPAETVADIESVTTHAGGGWNGPKHPADMRADSVAMYPAFQARP